jgi:hypothetical protein
MNVITTTITLPGYLAAPEPPSVDALLRATTDCELVTGAALLLLMLMVADSFPAKIGGHCCLADYSTLTGKTGLSQAVLEEAVYTLRSAGVVFCFERTGDKICVHIDSQRIWDAARSARHELYCEGRRTTPRFALRSGPSTDHLPVLAIQTEDELDRLRRAVGYCFGDHTLSFLFKGKVTTLQFCLEASIPDEFVVMPTLNAPEATDGDHHQLA